MANSKEERSENVNAIELNCKVVKKVASPPFLHQPPFLAKNFALPSDSIFGRSYAPLIRERGFQLCKISKLL